MKRYTVTLAQLAWIKGSISVEAESFADAFTKARADHDQADWPVNEEGDEVLGFGDVEIDSAFCADEAETIHEGEAPAADVAAYRAAPLLLMALKLALPYVERIAGTSPTQSSGVQRRNQAEKELTAIRKAISAAE